MISYTSSSSVSVWELYGKSSDMKPADMTVPNASVFYEMDTQKIYMFDAETLEWIEQ